MFSRYLTSLVLLASALTVNVAAVDVCAWSNTLSCSGTQVCCGNIGANNCCGPIPQGFGFSIAYNGLPGPVSDGQAWTSSNCGAGGIVTFQIGTGNKCWVGGGTKANSMAWTHAASRIGGRSGTAVEGNATTVKPNIFKFEFGGATKTAIIPDEDGGLEKLLDLYKAGDFEGLEKYELN